ncbi:hypothetical protein EGT07_14085 [Herbaspirillum sp. HC18]|nr:hypothetical protein EGT07_14085 [Herbaspirillum sp. HC18]
MFQDLQSQSDNASGIAGSRNRENKLLIAVRPEDVPQSSDVLGTEFDIVWCHAFKEAQAQLDAGVSMVVCGVHFDDGNVFDLLRYARSHPRIADVPFIIVLGADSRYSPAIVQSIRSASRLLGVTAFADLNRLAEKVGRERVRDVLRQGIRDTIGRN